MKFGSRKKFKVQHDKFRMRARRYKQFNEEAIAAAVDDYNWDPVLHEVNPCIAWDQFVKHFNAILDEFAPWRMMTFECNLPLWITPEYLGMCKERDNLKKKSKRTGLDLHRAEYN